MHICIRFLLSYHDTKKREQMETNNLKPWRLTLLCNDGGVMDSTLIYGMNRPDALKNAKRLLLWQGLTRIKYKLIKEKN